MSQQPATQGLTLTSGESSLTIDANHGAALTALVANGLELLVPANQDGPIWSGAFPMIPWAGLLRDASFDHHGIRYTVPADWAPHALHGLLRTAPWSIQGTDGSSARLTSDLSRQWSLGGAARLDVALAEHELSLHWSVTAGERSMPCTIGWHPWFRRDLGQGGPLEVDLPATAQWERDGDGIPTGRWRRPTSGPWDDSFLVAMPVTLRWPGALEVVMTGTSGVHSVYERHERGVVVATQSAPHEVFGHLLEPGAALSLGINLAWRRP